MAISQSLQTESNTSAYTLPTTPRKEWQESHRQTRPSMALHCMNNESSHEESTTSQSKRRSPSLPWLVEYWSTSLCRAPEVFVDQLCSCNSSVDHTVEMSRNNPKSKSKKTAYFDDTILRSDPKVDRSPTKISSTRWEALRSVVASHGDYTVQDYCAFYDKTAVSMSCEETKEEIFEETPIRTSLDSMDMEDEDDIRLQPPTDRSESMTNVQRRIYTCHSGRDINTCNSFDSCVDTSRFLCSSQDGFSTPPRATVASPLSPPTIALSDRRISRQAPLPNPSAVRTPSSPVVSVADTYTTISLSQSFAREFESEIGEELMRTRDICEGNLFLDRLAAETINNSPSRSPFRRPSARETSSEDGGSEEEKKEDVEDLENQIPPTPLRREKRASHENDDPDTYRRLIRMSPENYKHSKALSEDDWCDYKSPEEGSSQISSAASSSVLLPLHPHQRIIAPLCDSEDADADHSGYMTFRNEIQLRRIGLPNV